MSLWGTYQIWTIRVMRKNKATVLHSGISQAPSISLGKTPSATEDTGQAEQQADSEEL